LLQNYFNIAGFGKKLVVKLKVRHLHSSVVLDNVSNIISASEVSGLFDKLPVKLNNSPLTTVLTKEEIINKMQEL